MCVPKEKPYESISDLLLVIILGIAYLIDAYKKKQLPHFFNSVVMFFFVAVLAFGFIVLNFMARQEFVKEVNVVKGE